MSITRILFCLAAVVSLLGTAATARSQVWQPFIDPETFDMPLDPFARNEIIDFGAGKQPNTGWYFTYDRAYITMSRPDEETNGAWNNDGNFVPDLPFEKHAIGDKGWGNRYDFGYMTEEGVGWAMSIFHLGGPHAYYNQPSPEPYASFQQSIAQAPYLRQSLNDATLTSVELNRVWRLDPLHHGSVLEPFIGVRYMDFKDRVFRSDLVANELFPLIPPPFSIYEELRIRNNNTMIGGQLGMRWHTRRGPWVLSTEARGFAMGNYQSYNELVDGKAIVYLNPDETETDFQEIILVDSDQRTYRSNSSTRMVSGGELRVEAAYEVTQAVALRGGLELTGFHGVARGMMVDGLWLNNQTVFAAGVTFGFVVNR